MNSTKDTQTQKTHISYERDVLYARETVKEGSFSFDENVARVFTDMAQRSIPGYFDIQNFTAQYAVQYLRSAQTGSGSQLPCVLDIGASLGTSIQRIGHYANSTQFSLTRCRAIACDNSPHMLRRAKENLSDSEKHWSDIAYECVNIGDAAQRVELLHACKKNATKLIVVILHFVLQFIPLQLREGIVRDVWNAMEEKSVLIIGEKLRANDAESQRVWDAIYKGFKQSMGYSEKEIEGKRKALVGILRPMQENTFTTLLQSLPHSNADIFFAWGPFHAYAVHKKQAS